jgi:phenylacetate-CoA ligase
MYWMSGVREGTKILSMQSFGVRAELVLPLAAFKIGAVHVLPDMGASSLYQLEYLRPQLSWAYPGWLDGVIAAANTAGKDLDAVLEPLEILWFGGRYVSPERRVRLEKRVGATLYEVGGLGDIGLHSCSCSATDGMHVREDLFVVETVDPETGEPLSPGSLGELVVTSLFEEGMNHVRWRSDDIGVVKTDRCTCGRTSARIFQLGRVWERTVIDGKSVMPNQVDDILYEIGETEVPFQIVRSKDGSQTPFLRVAPPEAVGVDEIRTAVCDGLGLDLDVREVTVEEIVGDDAGGARLAFKYAQIKDV